MAIIKCKMCGGDLVLVEGQSVAECEYCGSRQTVPVADNEKKLTLFARANRLRAACEFDKAAGIYESIVADFPEEAESYWGLVLCKYGIEYVDDPATGKKIPTCHRSSFDSVMDDSNFDQALENADAVARRVYREEAKQIEEIRKGIIAVSANEQPYDIFICYKETDSNGDRTVDSLLAQDIYDALTEKGYRVFFSRITLEDKLGQAYEPYIFAALNSAKIMLAVGTCYEHYNAVWVKNEWSRYLKIIAQDKNKYLIPCYKGLDAYDIPKEFAHLQGQDMGKVGAIADLLRGIDKLLPKQEKNTVVIQEKVVVGGTGGSNKIASLLDRGNMALEDGDWAKADSFFEDVLNNDSKNAQAYIGKTLAQERCRTMDALVRKRRDVYQTVRSETLYIAAKEAHIAEMAEKYTLPGYVDTQTIRGLYGFDLSYTSEVSGRQKQYREEEAWWQNHKQLSRAEKFAVGAVAEHLQSEKKRLFAQLSDRVKKAQEADARSVAKLEAAYDAHIVKADAEAEKLYNDGLERREKEYQNYLRMAKNEESIDQLKQAEIFFRNNKAYKDSKNLIEHCQKRIADEQAKIDAENERQRVIAEQKKKARQRCVNGILILCVVVVVAVVIAATVVTKVIIPGKAYDEAENMLAEGKNVEAAMAFGAIANYKDAQERSFALWDDIASRSTFSGGGQNCVGKAGLAGISNNGEALLFGEDVPSEQTGDNFIAVALSYYGTYFLRNDGTVTGISEWKNIVDIAAGSGDGVFGLRADGTVVGYHVNMDGGYGEWEKIIDIAVGRGFVVGVKADGSVVSAKYDDSDRWVNYYNEMDVDGWQNVVSVTTTGDTTYGLKSDGTVYAVGSNYYGNCTAANWTDIVMISGYRDAVIGLKSDGTVVVAGARGDVDHGQNDAVYWNDIVAVTAGNFYVAGVKSDGRVLFAGTPDGFTLDWPNLRIPKINEELRIAMDAAKQEREAWFAAEKKTEEERLAKEYAAAEELAENREIAKAAIEFYKLADYQDARERCFELWDAVAVRETIGTGYNNTIALKTDGTAVATEHIRESFDYGQCKVLGWTDVVAISAGTAHTIGLKADGTVVATEYTGKNDYGQREVSSWTDIVAISAGSYHTVGLRADGTVVAVGSNSSGQCEVTHWTDIVAISAGGGYTVGLKSDGTVVVTEYTGEFDFGQCEVSGWEDIVAISAGSYHTVGLKADGTVVAVGNNKYGQCNVNDWTDIVAISVGTYHTVGLKADGTVVAVGFNEYGRCNVSAWRDIVAISAGNLHTVGLKSNGTMVAVGGSGDGQCDVSGWKDIRIPQ